MISNSNQTWAIGAVVRIGFLSLRVTGFLPTPGDGMPDAYLLESIDGAKLYRFVPHYGLERIN
jgi:hypothetical protein